MSKENLSNMLDFLVETAYLAGKSTLGYFQSGVQVDFKPDNTPVTVADRRAEELIRNRIEARFPTHAIVGEEFGLKETQGSSHRWFIDPIDGTKSFMRGVPLYGILIGLEIEGRVQAGAVYCPALDEMVYAADGLGCWWNGRRARVSTVSELRRSFVAITDPRSFAVQQRQAEFERLAKTCYHMAGWSDCYGYLLVATGRVEVMLDPIMNVWDCGPFPPILREAGGFFGDWQGNETIFNKEAIACSQALLPELLSVLQGNLPPLAEGR